MNIPAQELAIVLLLMQASAVADATVPKGSAVTITIDSQPLDLALNAWASQTGYSVLIPVEPRTKEKSAPRIAGTYAPVEALSMLLAGSELSYEMVNASTVAIRTADARVSKNSDDADSPGKKRLNDAPAEERAEENSPRERGIPEVLISGVRSLNADIERDADGAQPYVVFDRQIIEQSGAQDLQELLKTRLTMGATTVGNNQQNGGNNASSINLRGLGTDETLILIDGRRASGYGAQGLVGQPDINGIPLAAIERIEILPATASGFYGGGATGGVINVILRRDYSGIETTLTYANSFDSHAGNARVDLAGGFSLEGGRTTISMFGSWSDAEPLLVEDRDFARRAREHVLATNPADILTAIPPVGATTNISSQSGGTLTLAGSNVSLGSSRTFVPYGYAGVASDGGAALLANAGKYDLDIPNSSQSIGFGGNGRKGSLLAAPIVKSFSAMARREMASRLNAYLELSASENAGSFSRAGSMGTLRIPAGVPGNPFNEAIVVVSPTLGREDDSTTVLQSVRATGGVVLELPKGWSLGADYVWNEVKRRADVSSDLYNPGVTGAVSSGALNVFRDTNVYPIDFSQFVLPPVTTSTSRSVFDDGTLRISGPFPFALPGGGVPRLTALAEWREEKFGSQYFIRPITPTSSFGVFYPDQSQKITSFYVETFVPFISPANAIPGIQSLELQLAGRYDRYQINGASAVSTDANLNPITPIKRGRGDTNSVDPTIAFRYEPIQDLTLRLSYGTGFLAPAVQQLTAGSPSLQQLGPIFRVTDPLRGNELLGAVLVTSGGNFDLKPEKSTSRSAGFILKPRVISGLRVSADWTKIEKADDIAALSPFSQSGLSDLLLAAPERITRGAPSGGFSVGPITAIDATLLNLSRLNVEAVDLAVDYAVDAPAAGKLEFSGGATKVISIETQVTDTAPVVENVGAGPAASIAGGGGGALKWKAFGTLSWHWSNWTLGWTTRFYDSYFLNLNHTINPDQGSATIPSQTYHDFFGSYQFRNGNSSLYLLSNTEIRFGINNVFDKKPPLDVVGSGVLSPGYSYIGDPRLANYYLSIRKNFGSR